jgi:hypothetical protein
MCAELASDNTFGPFSSVGRQGWSLSVSDAQSDAKTPNSRVPRAQLCFLRPNAFGESIGAIAAAGPGIPR